MRMIIVTTEKEIGGETEFQFYSTESAKRFCNEHRDAQPQGCIYSVRSNGDWECLGELKIKGSNAHTMNTQTVENYN